LAVGVGWEYVAKYHYHRESGNEHGSQDNQDINARHPAPPFFHAYLGVDWPAGSLASEFGAAPQGSSAKYHHIVNLISRRRKYCAYPNPFS
jgi:hypothetical protein